MLPPFTVTVANAINAVPDMIGIVHGATQYITYSMSPAMTIGDPDVIVSLSPSVTGLHVTPSTITFTATGSSSITVTITCDSSAIETDEAYIVATSSDPLRVLLPYNGTEVAIRRRYYTVTREQLDYYTSAVQPQEKFTIEVDAPRGITLNLVSQTYNDADPPLNINQPQRYLNGFPPYNTYFSVYYPFWDRHYNITLVYTGPDAGTLSLTPSSHRIHVIDTYSSD